MIAGVLLLLGVAAIAAGALLLRRGGSSYRVGRLLAAVPDLSLAEAIALARSGEQRYIRTAGRIASDEEFPDENDRPLVFRRQRIQRPGGRGGWTDLDDDRTAVPFGIEERGDHLVIDVDGLGEGLVVVPRIAEGTAAELPPAYLARLPAIEPTVAVRLRIEQLSAVERVTAAGVPSVGPDGQPRITSGLGRPLIVTPLEPDAAMRVLAGEQRGAVRAAAVLLVVGLGLVAIALVAFLLGW